MLCDPWQRSCRLLRHFCFSSSFPRVPIPAEQGYGKGGTHCVQWGGRASARPLTWPRRDYIAPPEEEEKRRSNRLSPRGSQGSRQRRTPARIRQASWCLRGKTGPGAGPGSTQPGSKRPIERQRSAATYEGCGGTLPPRCPPAHASPARRERARPARAVPATDVHRPAAPHTTTAGTRPSSGPPGRWHAPLAHVQRQGAALARTHGGRREAAARGHVQRCDGGRCSWTNNSGHPGRLGRRVAPRGACRRQPEAGVPPGLWGNEPRQRGRRCRMRCTRKPPCDGRERRGQRASPTRRLRRQGCDR